MGGRDFGGEGGEDAVVARRADGRGFVGIGDGEGEGELASFSRFIV